MPLDIEIMRFNLDISQKKTFDFRECPDSDARNSWLKLNRVVFSKCKDAYYDLQERNQFCSYGETPFQ